ncbi:MAG: helix-turn-helix transcriptional regulator [Dehalococcoidia bacterium]
MRGTREQIVTLLRERGETTVAQLAETVGIAPPALRRHLDILVGEGTVEYRAVKQATGRPYFAYQLTERAREAAVNDYPRLLERLVSEVAALNREQTAAMDGRELLATVFANMTEHLAEDYQSQVHGTTIEERVASLTETLRNEGIVERWDRRVDGIHLSTSTCPHRRAAMVTHSLCDSEARLIAKLLGEDVEQVGRMVDGAQVCEYLVRCEGPANAPAGVGDYIALESLLPADVSQR